MNRFAVELDIGSRRTDVFNPPWVNDQNKPMNQKLLNSLWVCDNGISTGNSVSFLHLSNDSEVPIEQSN